MRRPAAVILGTLAGAVLMTAAKLGTPPSLTTETVAEAPLDDGFADPASPGPSSEPVSTQPPGASIEPQPGSTGTGTPTAPATTTTTAAAPPPAGMKNGTFTGSAVTHKYGTLQISIVVSGGAISDIRWTYTTSSPLSKNINADALPKLRSEALSIQTAQVHTVSGATYTSNAYRTSLQSAIDRAS
jgi:uncharacterized protein with FMN-binding domain